MRNVSLKHSLHSACYYPVVPGWCIWWSLSFQASNPCLAATLSRYKAVRHNHEAATRLANKEQGEKDSNIPSIKWPITFVPSQALDHDHTSAEGPRTRSQV